MTPNPQPISTLWHRSLPRRGVPRSPFALLAAALLCLWVLPADPGAVAPLPAPPAGWKADGPPAKYNPDNLYEYIDGAADLFLAFDFQDLWTVSYAGESKLSVTVDAYRHSDDVHAFGMYSQERPADAEYLPLGAEGYRSGSSLHFVAGPYYVKVSAEGPKEGVPGALKLFAGLEAAKMPKGSKTPAIFAAFPAGGRVARTERFTAKEFLGHAFLKKVFSVDYAGPSGKFRLFALEAASPEEAQQVLDRWVKAGSASAAVLQDEGAGVIHDPYNGDVRFGRKGRVLWGAVGEGGRDSKALVKELGKNLESRP